ncbi:HD domain-containing protein [Streptomyces malaysiensis]|uniref:HD domain-containing protein n=1 Tax=Streptomyces malaysiensis TaxID=92644 RepID=UPI003718ED45
MVAGKAMAGTVVQARSIGRLYVQQGGPEAESQPVTDNAWVRAAVGSAVWERVRTSSDVAFFRRQVGLIVEALAGLSDEAERTLGADPWRDPEVAVRFVERTEWLLGDVDDQAPLDLYPAEAALLVLIPFFYRTHALRMAAQYSAVDLAQL